MKRMNATLLCVVLIFGAVYIAPILAQQTSVPYTVVPGDNLWNLAGVKLNDPRLWAKVYERNPFLKEPGRFFTKADGTIVVVIKPGEHLEGLEELGIVPRAEKFPDPQTVVVREASSFPWWLLALLAMAVIAILLVERMLSRRAGTSGPPIVPGGVTPETADEQFRRSASANQFRQNGMTFAPESFTVLERTAGRIWGILNVRYSNGREIPRRMSGERAFRGRVRFPDGHEETLYMLQECGNDLRYGGISRYLPGSNFRFEADEERQPVEAKTEVPAPTPAPQEEKLPEGTVKFEFRKASGDKAEDMVRISGIDVDEMSFVAGPTGTTLRYKGTVKPEVKEEKPEEIKPEVKAATTGTK